MSIKPRLGPNLRDGTPTMVFTEPEFRAAVDDAVLAVMATLQVEIEELRRAAKMGWVTVQPMTLNGALSYLRVTGPNGEEADAELS